MLNPSRIVTGSEYRGITDSDTEKVYVGKLLAAEGEGFIVVILGDEFQGASGLVIEPALEGVLIIVADADGGDPAVDELIEPVEPADVHDVAVTDADVYHAVAAAVECQIGTERKEDFLTLFLIQRDTARDITDE